MNDILLWLAVNMFLVVTWSGSVAKGYLPFLDQSALYGVLIITLGGLSAAIVKHYMKQFKEETEND